MATITKGYTFGATETVTSAKLATLVDSATISNIVAADISSSAVTNAKINDVSGAKFTNLSSIPVSADSIPVANGGTGATSLAALYNRFYPVGIVITLGVSTNPSALLGFGTWTAIAGKVIVGIDAGQTEFDTLNETGGAKTHTLDISEIPAHTHSYSTTSDLQQRGDISSVDVPTTPTTGTTGSAGGGGAHNNLQPYIVKYVWERVS